MSAYLAAILSVRCSPPPPTRIGGPPAWIGFGMLRMSGHLVVAALERRPVLREHRLRDRQRLVEPVHALADRREVEPEGVVLGLEPGRTEPKIGAPAGDHVERRGRLREQGGVAVGHAGHERAEADRLRLARQRRQHRPGLEHRLVLLPDARNLVEVVHDGDHAEAGGLGRLGLLDDRIEQLLRRSVGEGVVGKVETEPDLAHVTSMPPIDRAREAPWSRMAPSTRKSSRGDIDTTSGCPDPAGAEFGAGAARSGPADRPMVRRPRRRSRP